MLRSRACGFCGNEFVPHKRSTRFCSQPCGQRNRAGDAVARFWSKVTKTGDCWGFDGGWIHSGGYRFFSVRRVQLLAHRFSWELANGPIPSGLWVLHRCDNRACVRPDHLFLGTVQDNTADMVSKGRQAKGDLKSIAMKNGKPQPNTRFITVNGQTKSMSQWARDAGLCPESVRKRLLKGWSETEAVTVPRRGSR